MTYPVEDGVDGLVPALEDLCMRAAQAASHGVTLLVLTDQAAGPERVPIRYGDPQPGQRGGDQDERGLVLPKKKKKKTKQGLPAVS